MRQWLLFFPVKEVDNVPGRGRVALLPCDLHCAIIRTKVLFLTSPRFPDQLRTLAVPATGLLSYAQMVVFLTHSSETNGRIRPVLRLGGEQPQTNTAMWFIACTASSSSCPVRFRSQIWSKPSSLRSNDMGSFVKIAHPHGWYWGSVRLMTQNRKYCNFPFLSMLACQLPVCAPSAKDSFKVCGPRRYCQESRRLEPKFPRKFSYTPAVSLAKYTAIVLPTVVVCTSVPHDSVISQPKRTARISSDSVVERPSDWLSVWEASILKFFSPISSLVHGRAWPRI